MKKYLFVSVLFSALAPYAAAQQAALDRVLGATDPALAAVAQAAAGTLPTFTVPPPVSITPGGRVTDAQAAEYLPLARRAVLEYEYYSSEYAAPRAVRVEFLSYSDKDAAAQVNMIIFGEKKPRVSNFVMTAARDGIRSTDSPLYGPRLELPLPLVYNASWNEGPDHSRVAALNAKVSVPAGDYEGCLKIATRLSGGDAGSAERYYAPGVGLVYERVISEDRQETLKLTSYQLK